MWTCAGILKLNTKLSEAQKNELRKWKKSDAGKKAANEYRKTRDAKRKENTTANSTGNLNTKKFRKAVAAVMAKEKKKEENNTADEDSKLNELAAKLVSSLSKADAPAETKVSAAKVTFDDDINAKVAALLKESKIQFK